MSLILTDPPYHSTKKDNIYGDRAFREDAEYIEWLRQLGKEFKRILRPNGAAYVFCSPEMAARIEVMLAEFLNPLNHITWTKPNEPGFDGWKGKMNKEALRRWYPHTERILFFEQAANGAVGRRSTLGEFLRNARVTAGLTGHELTARIGAFGAVNHGGAVSNWETGRNIPSREQYQKICDVLESTGQVDKMPIYEDVVRPFHMAADFEFTDVWTFPSVRPFKGKHPAEKPIDLLMHAIEASTFEGDVVLDCFAGSGSTLAAAIGLNRLAVGIDIEAKWVERASERLRASEDAEPALAIADARQRRLSEKRSRKLEEVTTSALELFRA